MTKHNYIEKKNVKMHKTSTKIENNSSWNSNSKLSENDLQNIQIVWSVNEILQMFTLHFKPTEHWTYISKK